MATCLRRMNRIWLQDLGIFQSRNISQISRTLSKIKIIDLGQTSGPSNVNLFDAYYKKKVEDEEEQEKIGPRKSKDFETRWAEERKKIINKYSEVEFKPGEWTENSRRAGVVGKKLGMTLLWRRDGRPIRVTLVEVKDCQVLDSRLGVPDGGNNHHTEIIIGGFDEEHLENLSEGDFGQYVAHGIAPKQKLRGFPVTKDALLPSGTPIYAAHFVPGQNLRIGGISQKQGFQGVMKRWGMKGQPASHGQTKTHRKMGATGGGGTPGRIFPGKKMAGHMGGNIVNLPSVKLYRINTKYNVLYIGGQIPGAVGDFIKIQDSLGIKRKFPSPPPFPTFIPDPENPLPEDIYAEEIHPYSEESFSYKGDDA